MKLVDAIPEGVPWFSAVVGHTNVREPVASWITLKVMYWPEWHPASVDEVTLPVSVISKVSAVFERHVNVGVAEYVTVVSRAWLPVPLASTQLPSATAVHGPTPKQPYTLLLV